MARLGSICRGVSYTAVHGVGAKCTYNLAVEEVLLDHDNVDSLGILECKEAEATGSARVVVTHDSALEDLAELREVVAKGFYISQYTSSRDGLIGDPTIGRLPVQSANEHLSTVNCQHIIPPRVSFKAMLEQHLRSTKTHDATKG